MDNVKIAKELVKIAKEISFGDEVSETKEFVKEVCEEALKNLKNGRDMEHSLKEMARASKAGLKILV